MVDRHNPKPTVGDRETTIRVVTVVQAERKKERKKRGWTIREHRIRKKHGSLYAFFFVLLVASIHPFLQLEPTHQKRKATTLLLLNNAAYPASFSHGYTAEQTDDVHIVSELPSKCQPVSFFSFHIPPLILPITKRNGD